MDRQKNRNYWASYGNPEFAWTLTLDCNKAQPDQLLSWVRQASAALYETGIYRIFAIPELGYLNPTADPVALADFLDKRYTCDGVIDLLYLSLYAEAGNPTCDIATSLSYYCEGDDVATEDCKDVAELQLKCQPWLEESTDSVYHRKPIVICGARFSPGRVDSTSCRLFRPTNTAHIRIETYTDIWLPFVVAINEPYVSLDHSMPNFKLAMLNGTRLNTALTRLREITLAIGGTWKVDDEFLGALRKGRFCETGVVLPPANSP